MNPDELLSREEQRMAFVQAQRDDFRRSPAVSNSAWGAVGRRGWVT